MQIKKLAMLGGSLFILALVSCGGGSDAPQDPPAVTACTNTVDDSVSGVNFIDGRIRSHQNGPQVYQKINAVRENEAGNPVSIDYMVHTGVGAEKALLVLIPGGIGNAKIEGTNGVDQAATKASGNFLVRSAHLFAAQGYKVVTIDRPTDFFTYTSYDNYRTSAKHAVDLVSIINKENTTDLPVIIAGTSRGAISAVVQSQLADAVALSSPVTSKNAGDLISTPIDESGPVKPSSVTMPTHVLWHVNDACTVTKPADSESLVTAFDPGATQNPVSGGFDATDGSACKGNSAHGFYGIESCAVGASTTWMDGLSLPGTRPVFNPVDSKQATVNPGGIVGIPVGIGIVAANGGELTYSLPHATTSLGGTVTISGDTVTYTAPDSVGATTEDSFVFIVSEAGGGKRSGVALVTITLN